METEENFLTFFAVYQKQESILQLFEYDTVGQLKTEVHKSFNIPPHKQVIEGWKSVPESDDTILNACAKLDNITHLVIRDINEVGNDDLEVEATISFVEKFLNNYSTDTSVKFHTCRLRDALSQACLAPLNKRKTLLLYLHNQKDDFSKKFCENLHNSEISKILDKNFFLLGWDVEESKYHSALVNALNNENNGDLSNLVDLVKSKVSAALCLVPIKDSVSIYSCLRQKYTVKDFITVLKKAQEFFIKENQQELSLEDITTQVGSENDIDSVKYQRLMADMLGDRDYDSFEYNEHKHLESKIAYSLFGPPQKIEETKKKDESKQEKIGYTEKQLKKVNELYQNILAASNEIAKYKDKVEVSFIYNCTEPLPAEKLARAKKFEDYNPKTDLMPLPIFVLRKCRGSDNPCRIFIDDIGRTYKTWQEYKSRNKLHKCEMVLPLNGRYEVNANGEVLLERHLSPACDIDAKILKGTDIVSTVGGLASGGIFVAAAIPAIAVAPAALIAGGVIGATVGVYSITRSAYTLYDRKRHKESLSFANSEARGAYINIVAGSLGFVGAGANMAVTQLAARGVNIGQGAGAVVNTIGFVNIGASGVSVVNSGYDVFDQWLNENQAPSWLTVVQLSSSVLFFGHAVYNFRMCSTIVEEVQTRSLQDYQESLRSNRHRKTFNKLLKESIRTNNGNEARGRAEVISAIRNIQNKDEVFAVLTRSNKEMTKKGIRFSAEGGEIRLNGLSVDMTEFASLNKKEANAFLSNLPANQNLTQADSLSIKTEIFNSFSNISFPDIENLAAYAVKILSFCTGDIRSKIIGAVASLLTKLAGSILETLEDIFPHYTHLHRLLEMVVGFFSKKAVELDDKYKLWIATNDPKYYDPLFKYIDTDKTKRYIQLFEKVVQYSCVGSSLTEVAMKELVTYSVSWVTKQVFDYQETKERTSNRKIHSAGTPTKKVDCSICGGYYFVNDVIHS